MYGAMRERALASTRMAGGATALTVTAALGLAVVLGMGGHALMVKDEPLMFTVMPDPVVTPPPERPLFDDANDATVDAVKPLVPTQVFEAEETPTRVVIDPSPDAAPGPGPLAGGNSGPPTPPRPPGIRTAAKIIPAAAPPYPPVSIRRNEQGVSTLEVCLDARGRVTSAILAASSGHDALDEAALKWVRSAKFTPAKLDGVAQAVCAHSVSYEWNLSKR
jgi:protein TonB